MKRPSIEAQLAIGILFVVIIGVLGIIGTFLEHP